MADSPQDEARRVVKDEDLDALRSLNEEATPPPWGVRYFEDDNAAETTRFATAVRLSEEHAGPSAKVCWRVISGGPDACAKEPPSGEKDENWLNVAFVGNGPTSPENAALTAVMRNLLPDLLAERDDLLREREALRAAAAAVAENKPHDCICARCELTADLLALLPPVEGDGG